MKHLIVFSCAFTLIILSAIFGAVYILRREFKAANAKMVERLSGVCHVLQRFENDMSRLSSELRRDLGEQAEAVKGLTELLENNPDALSREQEGAMSKAMEEGISNILGYTVGKGREQP